MSDDTTRENQTKDEMTDKLEDEDIPAEELLSDEERITVMVTALQSPQLIIRSTAVNQLVELGKKLPDKTIPKLVEALKDDYWSVRFGAVEALGEIGNPEVVPILVEYLEKDEDPEFRAKVAEQLGLIGDKKAVDPLIKALRNDSSEIVREFVAKSLGVLADEKAEPALREAARDQNNLVRREATWALGRIGKKDSSSVLISLLKDEDVKVRANAATALGVIKDPSAILPLIEALQGDNVEVHEAAKNALEQFEASTIFQAINKNYEENIYLTLGKIREAALSIGDEGTLMQLYKEKAIPIVEPLREKAKQLLHSVQEANDRGKEAFQRFRNIALQVDKLATLPLEDLKARANEIDEYSQELINLQRKIQKDLDFLAEISLYEFKKHDWIKHELLFDTQAIEREIDDAGARLRNLRELIESKKAILSELKDKLMTTSNTI